MNLYGFVGNDPLTHVDAYGLKASKTCELGEIAIDVQSMLTLPDETPNKKAERDDMVRGIADLNKAAGVVGHPAQVAAAQALSVTDIPSLFNSVRKSLLETRAHLYTRFDYYECETVRCGFLRLRRENRFVRKHSSDWRLCTINVTPGLGYHLGRQDALRNLDACVRGHVKSELGQ